MKQESHNLPDPPRGFQAILWRLPIWFYRLKLGWIMGHRALLLNHVGRVSGKSRQAVLEVVHFDRENDTHYVASGFGTQADWFKNITKYPQVSIQVAGNQILVQAEQLGLNDAEGIFREYHRSHPKALRGLAKLIGYEIPNDDEELIEFFRDHIPLIAFRPGPK
jgi:deazaflavin-dependent oxidoreductase (nitroreductase family)